MAFRAPHSHEKAAKCEKCRSGSPNLVGTSTGGHRWLCPACEYREAFPDAPTVPAHPQDRRPLPLQRETLFNVNG